MQYQKEEVRKAILFFAEKEFKEKGYERASIRNIVKLAGTTIGNFYNYFKSKEAIFEELVDEEYTKFIYFIDHHDEIDRPDYLWHTFDLKQWRRVLTSLIDQFLPMFTDKFLLIMECSQGTKYEDAKHHVESYLKEHFVEHMERYNSNYVKSKSFPSLMARQFLDGILIILKEYKDENERKNLILEHILFYFIGTMGLISND